MRCAKVIGVGLALIVLTWALWAGAHQEIMEMRVRGPGEDSYSTALTKGDTIWYSGFEPGDPLGVNVDCNAEVSPDEWHVTKRMLYQGTTTWMTAPVDSYFCHIGDDSTGYSDGNEVGYQIELDLTNYSDAHLYYLSAMQAYDAGEIYDKFVVWGTNEDLAGSWVNLDPGEGYAWGGDWGSSWYPPEDSLISLADLVGHAGVIIEFWFFADSGHPEGFGVGIDEIVITGIPATAVEEVEVGSALPHNFVLDRPYPNPFNAQVSIEYRVPDAEVHLGIYNVRGQLVKTLVQGSMVAGDYIVTWDGRAEGGVEVGSGVYFCLLRSADIALVRKMVLLR